MRLGIYQQAAVPLPVLSWTVKEGDSPEPGISCDAVFLFDVTSIQKARNMDLHAFPFVVPNNSFMISVKDCPHILFEAKSEKEQQRITHGLKLMIARIISDAVTGQGFFEWSSKDVHSWDVDNLAHAFLDDLKNAQ